MSALLTGEDLRAVMRHVASPVTIVTVDTPEGAKGITIGSFTSVSLDPPLISFNVMQSVNKKGTAVIINNFNFERRLIILMEIHLTFFLYVIFITR